MEGNEKFAKSANKDPGSGRMSKKVSMAVDILVKELGIINGSLKFFIRGGNASPRIEVQNSIDIVEIE